jgi:hypothetical protein
MAWNRACALSIAPEHDPGDRMLEFHRDQQCHDHAEDRLEHCMIQRVERPRPQQHGDRPYQLPQRYDNDHRRHHAQDVATICSKRS